MAEIKLLDKTASLIATLDTSAADAFAASTLRSRLQQDDFGAEAGRMAEFRDVAEGNIWLLSSLGNRAYHAVLYQRSTIYGQSRRIWLADFGAAFERSASSASAWAAVIGSGVAEPDPAPWSAYSYAGDDAVETERLHFLRTLLLLLSEY